jgi:hypothetical protein
MGLRDMLNTCITLTTNPYASPRASCGAVYRSFNSEIDAHLEPGERVAWFDRPSLPWRRLLVPLVISAGSALCVGVLGAGWFAIALFGVMCFLSLIAFVVVGFLCNRNTEYVLTARRAIIYTRRWGQSQITIVMPEELGWRSVNRSFQTSRWWRQLPAACNVVARPRPFPNASWRRYVDMLLLDTLLPQLATRLASPDPDTRRRAIGCLLRIGQSAAQFTKELVVALDDDDAIVRSAAAVCLHRMEGRGVRNMDVGKRLVGKR